MASKASLARGLAWRLLQKRGDGASYSGCERCQILADALDADKASSSDQDGAERSPWLRQRKLLSEVSLRGLCVLSERGLQQF